MSFSVPDPATTRGLEFQTSLRTYISTIPSLSFVSDVCRVWKTSNIKSYVWEVGIDVPSLNRSSYVDYSSKLKVGLKFSNAVIQQILIQSNEYDHKYLKMIIQLRKTNIRQKFKRQAELTPVKQEDDQSPQGQKFQILAKEKLTHNIVVIPVDQYHSEKYYPRHLLSSGVRVTRRFTGLRSLSTRLLSIIIDKLQKGAQFVRNFVKDKLGKPAKKTEPIKFVSGGIQHTSRQPELQNLPKAPTYNETRYDYSKHIRFSQLSNPTVFQSVRVYIIRFIGVSGYGKSINPALQKFSEPALLNQISAAGLPLNESLYDIYREYCQSLGMKGDVGIELVTWAKNYR